LKSEGVLKGGDETSKIGGKWKMGEWSACNEVKGWSWVKRVYYQWFTVT